MAMRMRRRLRTTADDRSRAHADEPHAPPTRTDDYGPRRAARAWLDVDWHAAPALRRGRRPARQRRRARRRRPPIVFVHGLAGLVAELAREPPALRGRRHRVIAFDLPGLRRVGDARARRSRSPATAASSTRCSTRWASGRRSSSATRWAASSRAELAIQFPHARRAARARQRRGPHRSSTSATSASSAPCSTASGSSRPGAAASARARTRSRGARERGRCSCGSSWPRPDLPPRPADRRAGARRGQARLRRRARRAHRLPDPRAPRPRSAARR